MTEPVWMEHPFGEYNEQSTIVNGVTITIYSDRDGETWLCRTGDDGDDIPLDATNLYDARRAALIE